jgi:hypothetical protein
MFALAVLLSLFGGAPAHAFMFFQDWNSCDVHDPASTARAEKAWINITGEACLPLASPPVFPANRKVCLNLDLVRPRHGADALEVWWIGPFGETKNTRTPFPVEGDAKSFRVYSCLTPPRPRWGAEVSWRILARINEHVIFKGEFKVRPSCGR